MHAGQESIKKQLDDIRTGIVQAIEKREDKISEARDLLLKWIETPPDTVPRHLVEQTMKWLKE